ncbi:unnamed protein product, partial [Staurois parvus]
FSTQKQYIFTPSYTRDIPCGNCSGKCSSFTLPCAPTMCPLGAASPAISSGRFAGNYPASVSCPCDVGTLTGRRPPPPAGNLQRKFYKNVIFWFFYILHICFVLCPACILSILS